MNKSSKNITKKKRWSKIFGAKEEKVLLLENMALLLNAGIDVSSALSSLTAEISNREIKKRLLYISKSVQGGSSLWRPMIDTRLFPSYAINLIKVGEETGMLARNLEVLADATKRDQGLRQNIISAMAYPIFVLFITVSIGLGITWVLLPRLVSVFDKLGSELPKITELLLGFGTFIQQNGIWFVPLVIISMIVGIYLFFLSPALKFIGQGFLLRLPGFKRLIVQTEVSRFGLLSASLMKAGVPLTTMFESLAEISTNFYYKRLYKKTFKNLMLGNSLTKSLNKLDVNHRLIPPSVKTLIAAGEKSGSLEKSFHYVGDSYDSKAQHATKLLTTLLEPVLLVTVWVGVLTLAIAIILPIYDVVGQFNGSPEELEVAPELPQNQVIDTNIEANIEPVPEANRDQNNVSER